MVLTRLELMSSHTITFLILSLIPPGESEQLAV